jgi:4-hydroxythreonine-4-phosphate dehydrogenase
MKKFVFTCGDINGIGPEIVIKTLNKISSNTKNRFYFICPSNVFKETTRFVKPKFKYEISKKVDKFSLFPVQVIDIGNAKVSPGKATAASGKISYHSIETAFELVVNQEANAIITAPISKTAFNIAKINFPGHTEMLAKWSGTKNYVMMFLSKKLNAALLTIHKPVKMVPGLVTKEKLSSTLNVLIHTLRIDLNILKPKIAVLGLNPHAGENGIIGAEEEKIIKPVVKKFQSPNKISGPFSPDAFFGAKLYKDYDLVLGMYHDQVLIPFKLLNFSLGVNYTAGLKIIRTSPDHGVAYDIAWKNKADGTSLYQAYKYAELISNNREMNE